ncbi:putative transposase Ptta/En/Spm plant [Arabidopsis suecica]|uniref:Putative transposase Ptta/En/Spm plant n=1 Tax=Arabidopsis suecica TaxID=45249 RepID=A0A8T2FYY1_ARASU|nr:putative transposase Ptta/En/Spm plant [Arabidopsis suecica]
MFGGNDYTRWLSQTSGSNPVGGDATSPGNTLAVQDNRQAHSRHSRRHSSSPAMSIGSPAMSTGSPAQSTGSPAISTGSPVLFSGSPSSPATGSPSTPASGSHSSPANQTSQPPSSRLNNLTLDELLVSPGREHLKKTASKAFGEDGEVAATVRSIFEKDFKEPHANWTQTPSKVIDRWFETFAQTYNWDRSINVRVRSEFDSKLKSRMCDQVCRWKGKWREIGDDAKPKWIDPEVWAALVKFWLDPKSEAKSINSRKARYHDPDGTGISKHRSGQTSFKARARKHSEKTGELTPDFLQVLEETHRKPDGSFTDGKSESIYKEVSSRIQELESELCVGENESSGSGGLSIHTKNKIYTEVAPRKKNRIYGVGSLQQEAASAHSGPPPPAEDPVLLAEKLAHAEAALQAQATQLQKSAEKMHQVFEYLAKKDPVFAAMLESENESTATNTEANRVSTPQTTPVTPLTGENMGDNPDTIIEVASKFNFFGAGRAFARRRRDSSLPLRYRFKKPIAGLYFSPVLRKLSHISKVISGFSVEILLTFFLRSVTPKTFAILVVRPTCRLPSKSKPAPPDSNPTTKFFACMLRDQSSALTLESKKQTTAEESFTAARSSSLEAPTLLDLATEFQSMLTGIVSPPQIGRKTKVKLLNLIMLNVSQFGPGPRVLYIPCSPLDILSQPNRKVFGRSPTFIRPSERVRLVLSFLFIKPGG